MNNEEHNEQQNPAPETTTSVEETTQNVEAQAPNESEHDRPAPSNSGSNHNVLAIPASAMADLKLKERNRGQRELLERLDREAVALGYENHADMVEAIKRAHNPAPPKAQTSPRPQQQATAPQSRPSARPAQRGPAQQDPEVRARLLAEERKRLNRRLAQEAAERKKAQRKLQSQEAEYQLKYAATAAGIEDVDYAIHLVRKHIRSIAPEELPRFNASTYFSDLRKTHPHLFGVQVTPATTAPSSSAHQVPTAQAPVPNGGPDAREMTKEQYLGHLKALGLRDPSLGL